MSWLDTVRVTRVKVPVLAYRVPRKGEVYLALNGQLKRCNDTHYSKRSHRKLIVWTPFITADETDQQAADRRRYWAEERRHA